MSHFLAMVLITGVLAACFTVIKAGLEDAPPLLFGGLRALIGGVALLGLVALRPGPFLPPRRTWPGLLALALLATAVTFGAMFLSPGRTEAGIASAAGNLQPFITLLLAWLFLGESLSYGKLTAGALGLVGVTLISYSALAGPAALGISGVVLAFASSAGASTGNVIVKRMRLGSLLLTVTAWQLVVGGLLLLLAASLVEDIGSLNFNLTFAMFLLFLALPGTAFTTALWYALVQTGEVSRLVTFFYLVPVFGLAIAVVTFGEEVTAFTLGGALAILLAVAVIALERPRAKEFPLQTVSLPGPEQEGRH